MSVMPRHHGPAAADADEIADVAGSPRPCGGRPTSTA